MNNECQIVITLHAVTEIRSRLQENISISHEAVTYAGKGVV